MTILLVTTTLLLTLLVSPSWSEPLSIDDLVEREGLYFKKFTDVPFTGKVSGKYTGAFKNGKKSGKWTIYYDNGQLHSVNHFKDGLYNGLSKSYLKNGKLMAKGNKKNNERDGLWIFYYIDSPVVSSKTYYREGKKDGVSESFYRNGNIKEKVFFTSTGIRYKREFYHSKNNGLLMHTMSCTGLSCKSTWQREQEK